MFFYNRNFGDRSAMTELMRKHEVDSVVHFAASCYVGESETDPFKYYNNNVLNTMGLLEAMSAAGVKRLVFSSSCATYGKPDFSPITEEHRQAPINTYGLTKYLIEQILFSLNRTSNLSFVALRYFNAAGANLQGLIGESHDPETHLIPNVLKAATGKLNCLEIYGDDYDTRDGTCVRDYVHVDDLAGAHIRALALTEVEKTGLGINLGTGHGASVKEVLETCASLTGLDIPHKVLARRPGDPAQLVADYSRAKEILGWTPKYDLATIIRSAWTWEASRRY